MRCVLRLLVALSLSLVLFSPSTASAQKGCQHQACNWFGQCYGCAYGPGFACSAAPITCPQSCTETRCDGYGPTEACLSEPLADPFGIQLATVRATQPEKGTLLLMLPQQGPVTLTEVTFGTNTLFSRGFALNLESQRVQTVRLGRARIHIDGKSDLFVANSVAVENVVDGRIGIGIGEQPTLGGVWELSPTIAKIVFFIAEAKFEDGRVWKADLDKIRLDLGAVPHVRAGAR